ncbi:hypothetical protein ITJ57_08280 [Plantibacter sp. VKM Ac-2880]|uniref:hypothetical protein n=1 Tax=Plantibacter sp. VKM Ac-2880 TaxID=2783827 RepID=UPI00188FF6DA|nr:hypothetical protein [Plantibacter sp. VKM Ac-2880]MBF4568767.1 hypothetical protein [Plantibacter sp. VKM Ac-2880]
MGASITLPRLAGTRNAAEQLVQESLGDDVSVSDVTVYARAVASAAPSFLDALFGALGERGIRRVNLVGASGQLLDLMSSSARRGNEVEVEPASAAAVS